MIHAENCTDGTDEWLLNLMQEDKNLKGFIEHNDVPRGIGGGMDFCVDKSETEYVNIIHSDMWIAPNQDIELQKIVEEGDGVDRIIASSFRIQPKIFPNDPDYRPGTVFVTTDEFGEFHHNFDKEWFDDWSQKLSDMPETRVRKGGGAGFFCKKEDYVWIGGNDPLFAPASYDDMDLFIRMQLEGYEFDDDNDKKNWINDLNKNREAIITSPGYIGDMILTCKQDQSRNYQFGHLISKSDISIKQAKDKIGTVEGYDCCLSLVEKSSRKQGELTNLLYMIINSKNNERINLLKSFLQS